MVTPGQKLAIYMEDSMTTQQGKLGFGVLRYSENPIACVVDSHHAGQNVVDVSDLGRDCPIVGTLEEARSLGAEVLILGIAPPGGKIPDSWMPVINRAVELGFSIANGAHDLLRNRYSQLQPGQWIWDIRQEPEGITTATGAAASLSNRRLLLIGMDMSIGKMTAGLEIHAEAKRRGVKSSFVATGQTGILIVGSGVPLDAIRIDFGAGAIEREVMAASDSDLVIVEGQGSLAHPASSATLPLIRGTMPTHFIMCVRHGQTHLMKMSHIPLPPVEKLIPVYEEIASNFGIFPDAKCVAISMITSGLSDEEAKRALAEMEAQTGLPATDPVRFGAGKLLDAVLA